MHNTPHVCLNSSGSGCRNRKEIRKRTLSEAVVELPESLHLCAEGAKIESVGFLAYIRSTCTAMCSRHNTESLVALASRQ